MNIPGIALAKIRRNLLGGELSDEELTRTYQNFHNWVRGNLFTKNITKEDKSFLKNNFFDHDQGEIRYEDPMPVKTFDNPFWEKINSFNDFSSLEKVNSFVEDALQRYIRPSKRDFYRKSAAWSFNRREHGPVAREYTALIFD